MSWLLRPLSTTLLILALAAASVSMAVARGHAAAAAGGSTLVICSGYGVMTIALNADGTPSGPAMPCPDCLAGVALAALQAAPALPDFTPAVRRLAPECSDAQLLPPRLSLPPARGPPARL